MLCGCKDVDHGCDTLIIPKLMPPPLPTMYPADSIKRWVLLYDITAGQRSVRDMQPVADSKDVVVALVQQHKAGLLQAVYAISSSEDFEQLLFEAYTDNRDADPATTGLFCSCCFTKLASLHLYALYGLVKRVANISANHLFAMQDLLNYLYLANKSLFDRNFHSIEMEGQIMLIKQLDEGDTSETQGHGCKRSCT